MKMKMILVISVVACLLLGAAMARAGEVEPVYLDEVMLRIVAKEDLKDFGFVDVKSISAWGHSLTGNRIDAHCRPYEVQAGQLTPNSWTSAAESVCKFKEKPADKTLVAFAMRMCTISGVPKPKCKEFTAKYDESGAERITIWFGMADWNRPGE